MLKDSPSSKKSWHAHLPLAFYFILVCALFFIGFILTSSVSNSTRTRASGTYYSEEVKKIRADFESLKKDFESLEVQSNSFN